MSEHKRLNLGCLASVKRKMFGGSELKISEICTCQAWWQQHHTEGLFLCLWYWFISKGERDELPGAWKMETENEQLKDNLNKLQTLTPKSFDLFLSLSASIINDSLLQESHNSFTLQKECSVGSGLCLCGYAYGKFFSYKLPQVSHETQKQAI